MRTQPKYKYIVNKLLETIFQDIGRKRINVRVSVSDDPKEVGLYVWRWGRDYDVVGGVPKELVGDPQLEQILEGMLGHEFSHIARGDYGGLREVYAVLVMIPVIGKKIHKHVERATDEETIKRGLGKQLFTARKFFEEYARRNRLSNQGIYYTSQQLRNLIYSSPAH